jgi:hypothetical protein
MVSGIAPGSRPARAAPSSTRVRLTAIRSGVAQLSRTPSAVRPASRSICGPSAARYTGAGGRSGTPSDAERGQPGVPPNSPAVTRWPASSPRTSVTYSRMTAIGRSGRPTDFQNPGP